MGCTKPNQQKSTEKNKIPGPRFPNNQTNNAMNNNAMNNNEINCRQKSEKTKCAPVLELTL